MLKKVLFPFIAILGIVALLTLAWFADKPEVKKFNVTQQQTYQVGREVAYRGFLRYCMENNIKANIDSIDMSIDSVERAFILEDSK